MINSPLKEINSRRKSRANSAGWLWAIFKDFYVHEPGGEGRTAVRSFTPQRVYKRWRTRVISRRTTAEVEMIFDDYLTPSHLIEESLSGNLGLENGELSKVLQPMIQLGCRVLAQCSALCRPDLSPHGHPSPHDHTWPRSERNTDVSQEKGVAFGYGADKDAGKERERHHE